MAQSTVMAATPTVLPHHQLDEVRAALATSQLVVFIGGRGTGKTRLLRDLESAYVATDIEVIQLDVAAADSLSDLSRPVANRLGASDDSLSDCEIGGDVRVRVLIDNCEHLHKKPWLEAF